MKSLFHGKTDIENMVRTTVLSIVLSALLLIGVGSIYIFQFYQLVKGNFGPILILATALSISLLLIAAARKKFKKQPDGRQAKSLVIGGLSIVIIYVSLMGFMLYIKFEPEDKLVSLRHKNEHGAMEMLFQNIHHSDSDTATDYQPWKEWKKRSSGEGGFSIDFPEFSPTGGDTMENISSYDTYVIYRNVICTDTLKSTIAFSVSCFYIDDMDGEEQKEGFKYLMNDVLWEGVAKLKYKKEVKLQTYNGIEFGGENKIAKLSITGRMIYGQGIMYRVLVVSKGECVFKNEVSHFLESLVLEKKFEK